MQNIYAYEERSYFWRWVGLGAFLFLGFLWVKPLFFEEDEDLVRIPVSLPSTETTTKAAPQVSHFSSNTNVVPVAATVSRESYVDSNWLNMEYNLSELVAGYRGVVGIYIKDLKTGKTYERNADRPFVTASLIKVPIMAAACQAMSEGRLSMNTTTRLRRDQIRGGAGDLQNSRVGTKYQLSTLIYKMITKSDNTAAQMVIDQMGYNYLNRSFKSFGLNVTRINPVGMSLANYVSPEQDNHTTPREMGLLLEKIYRRQIVNDGACDFMVQVMRHVDPGVRLSRFLPRNWKLARKGGLLRRNCHDVGIVYTPKANYVICVLTSDNANYERAKRLIATVGQTAYAYLGRS